MKHLQTTFAIIASTIIIYGCSSKASTLAPALPTAEVIEISAGSETTYQDYPAAIEGATNVEIRPQVDGYLQKVLVDDAPMYRQAKYFLRSTTNHLLN